MNQPKRGLGRGLEALFGGAAAPVAEPAAAPVPAGAPPEEPPPPPAPAYAPPPTPVPAYAAPTPTPTAPTPAAPAPAPRRGADQLDIDLISPNPEQPRTHFEPEKLHELAASIREHGIIQPLIVTRDEHGGYRLIAGERRLQAARLAGLHTVPVVFRETTDTELLEVALIENIQRADLNAIEEAMAYRRLTEEHGLTQEEAARRVGKSRAAVANALRLLVLEPEIRRSLVAGEISEGHARALLGLQESRARLDAWREVLKKKLSVRDTEAYVRRSVAERPSSGGAPSRPERNARRDATLADIEARLRRALGTRVSVVPQRTGARITIDCYSAEEFENVIVQILGDEED
jgi:ParB family chromosome partitioning protein